MSYYELRAEQKRYFHFYHREGYETPAHFHGSIELVFVESGELPVSIDGETRILKSGEGYFCDSFPSIALLPPQIQAALPCWGNGNISNGLSLSSTEIRRPVFFASTISLSCGFYTIYANKIHQIKGAGTQPLRARSIFCLVKSPNIIL